MNIKEGTKISPELFYDQYDVSFPSYNFRNVYPANGGARTVTVTSVGELQKTVFNIPAEDVNLGYSYLEYDLNIPDQGAPAGGREMYACTFKDVYGEYDSVIYNDTGSQNIVEMRNLNLYNSVMNRIDTTPKDLEYAEGMNGLERSDDIVAAGTLVNYDVAGAKSRRFDNTNNALPYKDVRSLQYGPPGDGAGAGSFTIKRRITLAELCGEHSFFGYQKDWIFPQETYLTINWSGNRIGFKFDAATRAGGPPAVTVIDHTVNNAALVGNITITNLVLKLAVQTNQELIAALKQRVAAGMTLPIPYTKVHLITGSGGSQATCNLTLDAGQHGKKIKRLIYVPFRHAVPAGSSYLMYDHRNNQNRLVLSNYYTELDNAKLQRDIIVTSGDGVANVDDYMLHRKLLQNTTYFTRNSYNFYWFHMEAFDDIVTNEDHQGAINTKGWNLIKPTIWSLNKTNGTNEIIQNMVIVQGFKLLTVNSASFIVV